MNVIRYTLTLKDNFVFHPIVKHTKLPLIGELDMISDNKIIDIKMTKQMNNKQIMQLSDSLETVINHDGVDKTFIQVITQLSTTRMKTYPSLSSKSIFKCMDL